MKRLEEISDQQAKQYSEEDFTESPLDKCAVEDITEDKVRIEILLSAVKSADRVYDINTKNEHKKAFWRGFFIIFLSALLGVSLTAIGVMLFLEKLDTPALIACLSYVVANIVALLHYMVKYAHNDLYLETFKTVTQKLLDYLIEDKNSQRNLNNN